MDKELYEKVVKALKGDSKFKPILDLLQLKDENEIEGAIGKLKTGKVKFEEIVKDKDYQSDLDKLLAKAANTREENLKEKFNFIKKDSDEKDDKKDEGGEKLSKVYAEMAELKKQLGDFEAKTVLEKKQNKAKNLLKENKLPSKFLKLFSFDADESIEDQFKEIQEEVGEFKTNVIEDLGVHGRIPIPTGGGKGKATESEINEIIKDL